MNSWSSNYTTSQMASNLMKWWRSKFLGGYKPFTVESNDRLVSDTEELLGTRRGDYQTSCTTPPLQTQSNSNFSPISAEHQNSEEQQKSQNLNLQEFTCDVSVEGQGPIKNAQERQEFSFTLYDFDGHGKVTKDDITGLVTTIYEVLGSSVKVPHYGSKTIKVKLTVSPDQRKYVSATVIDHKDNKLEDTQPIKKFKSKENLNITINKNRYNNKKKHCQNNNHKEQENRKHYCCRKLDEGHELGADVSDDYSDICSRISENTINSDEEKHECSDDQILKCNKLNQNLFQKHSTSKYKGPNHCTNESTVVNQKENCLHSKKVKKRSSSLQRQELLENIQSNMAKNGTSFQTARKPCTSNDIENKQFLQNEWKHNRHRSKKAHTLTRPLRCLANIVNPSQFYVDLASLQNSTHFSQVHCQYDKLIDAVICVCNKKVLETKNGICKHHNHCKSYDQSNSNYQSLDQPSSSVHNLNKPIKRSKSTWKLSDFEPTATVKKNIRKFPHVVLGHTSSPHHLRHRNRQEDQARAMAQVVRWLEQEFSSNLHTKNTNENLTSNCWTGDQKKHSCNVSSNANSNSEHHEHHHVHEHIHHHYHHYQETPVLV